MLTVRETQNVVLNIDKKGKRAVCSGCPGHTCQEHLASPGIQTGLTEDVDYLEFIPQAGRSGRGRKDHSWQKEGHSRGGKV